MNSLNNNYSNPIYRNNHVTSTSNTIYQLNPSVKSSTTSSTHAPLTTSNQSSKRVKLENKVCSIISTDPNAEGQLNTLMNLPKKIDYAPTKLIDFPTDLLRKKIFTFLKPEDFFGISRVNKLFYQLIDWSIIDWLNSGKALDTLMEPIDSWRVSAVENAWKDDHKIDSDSVEPFWDYLKTFLRRNDNHLSIKHLDFWSTETPLQKAFNLDCENNNILVLFPNLTSLFANVVGAETGHDDIYDSDEEDLFSNDSLDEEDKSYYGFIDANFKKLETLKLKHSSLSYLNFALQNQKFSALKTLILHDIPNPKPNNSNSIALTTLAKFSESFPHLQVFKSNVELTEKSGIALANIAQFPIMANVEVALMPGDTLLKKWFSIFGENIMVNTQLHTLIFHDNVRIIADHTTEENIPFAKAVVEKMPSLRTLAGCVLTGQSSKILASNVNKISSLEDFQINYPRSIISADDLACLALLPNLQAFRLHCLNTTELTENFLGHLKEPVRFLELDLSESNFSNDLLQKFTTVASKFHSVKSLSFWSNLIDEEGMGDLAVIEKVLSLKTLNLGNNKIKIAGLETLHTHLSLTKGFFSSLQDLNLAGNPLFRKQQEGTETLAEIINDLPSLRDLSLANTGIADEGIRRFVAKINKLSLHRLDLSQNKFATGAETIIPSTEKFCSIGEFALPNNQFIRTLFYEFYKVYSYQKRFGISFSEKDTIRLERFMDLYKSVKKGSGWQEVDFSKAGVFILSSDRKKSHGDLSDD